MMIPIEEEPTVEKEEKASEQPWSEEFTIAGIDLVATIKDLIREVTIRRIEIRNKEGKTLLEVPLVLGVVGVAVLNFWASLALIAAWVAELSILVVRAEPAVDEGEEIEITFQDEGDFEIVIEEEEEFEIIIGDQVDAMPKASGKVNINKADLDALIVLPGIAASMAQRIIDYRQDNGKFGDISELTKVSGIGKAKLEQIAGMITV